MGHRLENRLLGQHSGISLGVVSFLFFAQPGHATPVRAQDADEVEQEIRELMDFPDVAGQDVKRTENTGNKQQDTEEIIVTARPGGSGQRRNRLGESASRDMLDDSFEGDVESFLDDLGGISTLDGDDEGNLFSFQGMAPEMSQLTLGGQKQGRGGTRLGDMPVDMIESITVIKSPVASMEEGASGGTVNVELRSPANLQKQIMGINHIQFIMAFLKDTSLTEQTAEDLRLIMRDQHEITDPDKDDFMVVTTEEMNSMIGQVTGGITLLLIAIAGISLLVGGVGSMNIMYVSVSERTYEIGLRKAIGATQSNILWQFLWEAMFLTFLGGLIGVILGTLFTQVALIAAKYMGFDFGNIFSWSGIILGVGFSVVVGLVFGIYPARKAAKMVPITAL